MIIHSKWTLLFLVLVLCVISVCHARRHSDMAQGDDWGNQTAKLPAPGTRASAAPDKETPRSESITDQSDSATEANAAQDRKDIVSQSEDSNAIETQSDQGRKNHAGSLRDNQSGSRKISNFIDDQSNTRDVDSKASETQSEGSKHSTVANNQSEAEDGGAADVSMATTVGTGSASFPCPAECYCDTSPNPFSRGHAQRTTDCSNLDLSQLPQVRLVPGSHRVCHVFRVCVCVGFGQVGDVGGLVVQYASSFVFGPTGRWANWWMNEWMRG